jgi:hypothetical protein
VIAGFISIVLFALVIVWMVLFKLPSRAFRAIRGKVSLALSDYVRLPQIVVSVMSLIILLGAIAVGFGLLLLVGSIYDAARATLDWLTGSYEKTLLVFALIAVLLGVFWVFQFVWGKLQVWRNTPE